MVELREWIDISVPLRTGMVHYPGDPPLTIERVKDIRRGDPATVSFVSMGVHSGTHIDAPLHFSEKGESIEKIPFAAIIGAARVIAIEDGESIKADDLNKYKIAPQEIILFKTRNSEHWKDGRFFKDYVYLSTPAARHLVDRGVTTVGVDYLSVGGFARNEEEVHQILLGASVWVVEGLNLSGLQSGIYEFVCLPLRIEGGEAAPARAVVRKINGQ